MEAPGQGVCAALRGAVGDSPALSSVQAQNVRRLGAREKVCCLPTRMMSFVLGRTVPREGVADPVVCPPRLGGLCKTAPRIHSWRSKTLKAPPRIHSWRSKHWHYAHQMSSLNVPERCGCKQPRQRVCSRVSTAGRHNQIADGHMRRGRGFS
jgi:hypothetical protein